MDCRVAPPHAPARPLRPGHRRLHPHPVPLPRRRRSTQRAPPPLRGPPLPLGPPRPCRPRAAWPRDPPAGLFGRPRRRRRVVLHAGEPRRALRQAEAPGSVRRPERRVRGPRVGADAVGRGAPRGGVQREYRDRQVPLHPQGRGRRRRRPRPLAAGSPPGHRPLVLRHLPQRQQRRLQVWVCTEPGGVRRRGERPVRRAGHARGPPVRLPVPVRRQPHARRRVPVYDAHTVRPRLQPALPVHQEEAGRVPQPPRLHSRDLPDARSGRHVRHGGHHGRLLREPLPPQPRRHPARRAGELRQGGAPEAAWQAGNVLCCWSGSNCWCFLVATYCSNVSKASERKEHKFSSSSLLEALSLLSLEI